ncbi:MAG: GFA family protein [Sphingobium sp.]|nr:GFA family protein [Sphingobium sp.]
MPISDATEFGGGCHCGAVRFHVRLDGGFAAARRCNCSLCRMRGAVALSALLDDFTLQQGADTLTEYRFNTGEARHYFCSVCGIYTHHQRRSNPHQLGINAACLDGVSPFDFAEVPVLDGVNHPNDAGRTVRLGTLRFEPWSGEG